MKYDDIANEWALYLAHRNVRWDVFDLFNLGSIDEVLNEIDLDQTSIFWG